MLRSLVRRCGLPPSTQLRRVVFFSTGTSVSSSGAIASPDPHFLIECLVDTCGFSANDASKVYKSLPSFLSAERLEAVLGFFISQGLDGANLRRLITCRPKYLGCDVETNLAPKFKILRDMGLSESDVVNVVIRQPSIISLNAQNRFLPRLKFWESLFGSREILLRNLRIRNRFIGSSIENVVRPNLNFLRDECGFPEDRVSRILKTDPSFIVQNPDALRDLVDRADGFGIPRESRMFFRLLLELYRVSREKFEGQVKLMNSFGWSNSDFIAAFKKHPALLGLSTGTLQRKMEFFITVVEITPSDIANRPTVLDFSLEKRLIPRFHVMKILKSEGLWTSKNKLHGFFLSDPKFLQKCVLPYKDKLPKLLEVLGTVAEFEGNNPNNN